MRILQIALFGFILFQAGNLAAAVTKATVYPHGATLTATAEYKAGNIKLQLPASTDTATLRVKAQDPRFNIQDVAWQKVTRDYSDDIQTIKDRIRQLEMDNKADTVSLQTVQASIAFWQAQLGRDWEKAEDALKIASAYREPLARLFAEQQTIKDKQSETGKQIKELQERLRQLTSQAEKQWQATITLAGPAGATTGLTWNYYVANSGFRPGYRLNALPEQKQVQFTWEAEVWQKTGEDWQGVDLTLASTRPGQAIYPPRLNPWIITPVRPVARQDLMYKAKAPSGAMMDADMAAEPAAREVRRSTYTEWQVGKSNIQSGPARRIHIKDENWPAEFVYLLRPDKNKLAFLQANVTLKEGRQIPPGEGLFLVEGTMVGKHAFELQGKEIETFFGSDNLVTAKKKLLDKKSGESGLVFSKQTFSWHWQTTLTNNRNVPVKLVLQEAEPQSRNDDVEVTWQSDPAASKTEDGKLVWEMTVQAGKSRTIDYHVDIEAPKDMRVDPGR